MKRKLQLRTQRRDGVGSAVSCRPRLRLRDHRGLDKEREAKLAKSWDDALEASSEHSVMKKISEAVKRDMDDRFINGTSDIENPRGVLNPETCGECRYWIRGSVPEGDPEGHCSCTIELPDGSTTENTGRYFEERACQNYLSRNAVRPICLNCRWFDTTDVGPWCNHQNSHTEQHRAACNAFAAGPAPFEVEQPEWHGGSEWHGGYGHPDTQDLAHAAEGALYRNLENDRLYANTGREWTEITTNPDYTNMSDVRPRGSRSIADTIAETDARLADEAAGRRAMTDAQIDRYLNEAQERMNRTIEEATADFLEKTKKRMLRMVLWFMMAATFMLLTAGSIERLLQ